MKAENLNAILVLCVEVFIGTVCIAGFSILGPGCDQAPHINPAPVPTQIAPSTWEYKVLYVEAPSHEKTGVNALDSNEIQLDEAALNALGKGRWELTGAYLEPETSFPNLGDTRYVTGIESNVRPMRSVLLFKRHVQ